MIALKRPFTRGIGPGDVAPMGPWAHGTRGRQTMLKTNVFLPPLLPRGATRWDYRFIEPAKQEHGGRALQEKLHENWLGHGCPIVFRYAGRHHVARPNRFAIGRQITYAELLTRPPQRRVLRKNSGR